MRWGEVTLGELIDVKHGFAFKSRYFADEGHYILLTPGNCHDSGGLKLKGEKEKYYAGDIPDGYLLHEGDLMVVMTDLVNNAPILGGSFLIPQEDKYLHNQRLGLVEILDSKRIDKRFAYYLLNTYQYRSQVRGSASGATVRHTSPSRIRACRLRIPLDVTYQKQTALVLAAYDELIENNRRRMTLLEEAARQLYREWFVRLRFPGHEHTRIIDGVPEGWARRRLEDLAKITMGQSPSSKLYNEDGEGLPFHQGVADFGDRFVSHRIYTTAENRIAEAGDILCSVRAPVGRLNLTTEKIVIGRGLAAIRSLFECQSFLFYQMNVHFFKEDLIGAGAIFASVSKKELFAQEMLTPTDRLIALFEETSRPIDDQLRVLTIETAKLRTARDLLLPRLMSGEIAV